MIGSHVGWLAPAIVKLKKAEEGLVANNEQISWIASLSEIGRFFGPLITALFLDKIGRKSAVFLCSLSFFIVWLLMIFANSISLIYCVRFLVGITQGVNDVTCTIYVAEICTPKVRGIMSGTFPLCLNTAFIIQYILAAYGSFTFVAAVNTAIGFGTLFTSFFVKETPYYLLMKGRIVAAKRNLLWLRGKSVMDSDIKFELDKIQQNMQMEILKKRSLVTLFGSSENYKSLIIVMIFSFLLPIHGYSAIITYVSIIFQPSSVFSVNEFTIMYGIFQLAAACVSPFIIERYNRRGLLLSLLGIMGVCQICTFILYLKQVSIDHELFSWLIFTTITAYYFIFSLTLPLVIIIRSELIPMSVRAVGVSLGIMTSSLAASISVRLFLPISDTFGIGYNFLFFFVGCILKFVFVLVVLPETRGKSLVDIQVSLEPSRKLGK